MIRISKIKKIAVIMLLGLLFVSNANAVTVTVTGASDPLSSELSATMDWLGVTEDVDNDDWTMETSTSGSKLNMPVDGAYIYSNSGESAVDTGTSYISLEESTILGDYASESKEWTEYVFLETTYGSVTETYSNQTQTAPSLTASSSNTYISFSDTYSSSSGIGAFEYSYFVADIWNDIDGDDTDDSVTVTQEEYQPLTKNVYILVVAKIDSSDVDALTYLDVNLGFYAGASDYNVMISFIGGGDSSTYTHQWTYTDGSQGGLSYNARMQVRESEDEYVAVLIDLADLISDDTDSSPNISGINDVSLQLFAASGYGDGTADSLTGYISNIAIFDKLPALTDRDLGSGNTVDWNGGATNTAIGDATNYDKHDILLPYCVAASNNDWDTLVYFENDVVDNELLLSKFHMLSMNGVMRIPPNREFEDSTEDLVDGTVIKTEVGTDKQRRDVSLYFDLDYVRPSDGGDFDTSGFAPVLSAHNLIQVLDTDDNYVDSVNNMEKSLISAELGTADKTDEFESAWDGWSASSTSLTIDLWSTDPSDGDNVEIHYAYYTHESANEEDVPQTSDAVFFNWGASKRKANEWFDNPYAVTITAIFLFAFGIGIKSKRPS